MPSRLEVGSCLLLLTLPFALLLVLPAAPALAQHPHEIGIGLLAGLPQGEFGDNVEDTGWGVGGYYGYNFQPLGLMLGLDLGYLTYGSETREEPFSTTIPDVTVEVTNSNRIFQTHLLLRYGLPAGRVRPFVEGLFGLKYLFTETTIRDRDGGDDEEIASDTNFDDTALSYGLGGGLDIELYRAGPGPVGKPAPLAEVHLILRGRYLFGGEADYLKEGSIRRGPNATVEYDVSSSKTDLLTLLLGVGLRF
jgi:hypothetical protein